MEVPAWFLKTIFLFSIFGGKGSWSVAKTDFSIGDFVRITSDESLISELHSHSIGYNPDMEKALRKIGRIDYIDSDGDLWVYICDTHWIYSARAVTKLASADDDSSPQISSFCRSSQANVAISERRLGNYVYLECKVDGHFDSVPISVRWIKGNEFIDGRQLRFTSQVADQVYTLKITDVKPEDSGWYTCEVMQQGFLIATNAVELNINQQTNFEAEDLVQITSNKDFLSKVNSHGRGYTQFMEETLGKIGKVSFVYADGDLAVDICGTNWLYSPKVVTKLTSAGTTAPFISSHCVRSPAKITVKQETVNRFVKLECSVVNRPYNSILTWKKGSEPFVSSTDRRANPPLLEIRDATSRDEGWYTCELRDKDGNLAATGALELKVLRVGDLVQITSDEDLISEIHRNGIGYVQGMEKTLGKIGVVSRVDEDDILVIICSHRWSYSPEVVTKLASAGNSTPPVSSRCVNSGGAFITVKQKTYGNSKQLECSASEGTVQTHSLKTRWLKGSDLLTRDSSIVTSNRRIIISPNVTPSNYTLNVIDVKPEDAGWYTCELYVPDGVVATGAVLLDVQQPNSTS